MNFTWICYKPGESPEIDDPSSLPVVYPDGTSSASTGSGGCFNKGPGRLPFNDTSFTITFDNSLMVRGHTYYIILRVEKRQRFDYYTQKVAVAEAPPPFNIRYAVCLQRIMHSSANENNFPTRSVQSV